MAEKTVWNTKFDGRIVKCKMLATIQYGDPLEGKVFCKMQLVDDPNITLEVPHEYVLTGYTYD